MTHNRRRFLQSSLGASALVSLGWDAPSFLVKAARAAETSAKPSDNVLVVVQLSGGNDGLNTVVPYADEAYAANRVALRVGNDQVRKIDANLGFHPSLEGYSQALEAGRLAIVQGVGYPNPDRSHFRSMDIWHSARAETVDVSDGWLGRAIDQVGNAAGQDVPALHLGASELPVALISRGTPVPSIESLESFRLRDDAGALPLSSLRPLADSARPAAAPPGANDLLDFLRKSTLNAYASSEQVRQALAESPSAAKYPESGLAKKLRNIAQLIDAGLSTSIYYISLDGFDTHANQAEAHAALLTELAAASQAFLDDLQARGHLDRVLMLTFSEFGRRVHENASQGTDHGTSAPVFLAGGRVKSGPHGAHPSLTDLDGEGDMKFHTDFRRVYATILDLWLRCSSETVLAGKYEPLDFLA